MTRVYRIVRKQYASAPFDGEGAYRYGGRWSSPGVRIAYASQHLSLALVEYFVHIEGGDAPSDLVVVSADVPDSVSRARLSPQRLPAHWRSTPAPPELTHFGNAFSRDAKAAALVVPSVIAPNEQNWLLNPTHPEFARIRVNAPEPFAYDPRFFG